MENKIPAIMLCLLVLLVATSSSPRYDKKEAPVNPTVNGFYMKVGEVERIASRLDTSIKMLDAGHTEHIAIADTSGSE